MSFVALVVGIGLVVFVLYDGFEAMVLPRRVTRRLRPSRLFYRGSWGVCRIVARLLPAGKPRDNFLSVFGPLSLLALFATWVFTLIVGFALIQWGAQAELTGTDGIQGFAAYWYLSGETFFTLGYGDVTPTRILGRAITVLEAGIGFGFMAVIIGYLPTLYQAFSRREQSIALLDARAGSPPTAFECLRRLAESEQLLAIGPHLEEWERWAADLLESHLSFPVLSYYRSQHDNQSWLAALAATLDTSAALLAMGDQRLKHSAQLTFAMARHVAVDLSLVFWQPPSPPARERLTPDECRRLSEVLGIPPEKREGSAATHLAELRGLYEPFLASLARYFLLTLPRFVPDKPTVDNWQTSAWTKRTPGIGGLPMAGPEDQHFD
ncbi:MAG: two pore domain potassium channel family protein [Planctomycetia bacterium]|nr:two pore domain potassium channel family protein [Planctomycetia bacterium]